MRVLFVTSQLPYPPQSGGTIKSWNLVKRLSELYAVSMVTLLKGQDASLEHDFLQHIELEDYYSKALDIPRSAVQLIRSYFSNKTLNLHRNFHPEVQLEIIERSKNADILFIDHFEMFQYVPSDFRGKVVLHEHNAEFETWKNFADLELNPVKAALLRLEANRVKSTEVAYCSGADLVLASPNDKLSLEKAGAIFKAYGETYHLGDDSLLNEPELKFPNETPKVLYVGTLTWEPNIDGLLWFLDEVWPLVMKKNPAAEFHVVGRSPDARLLRKGKKLKNIFFAGFVENLDIYYNMSHLMVAPMRFGSGMKVKVLNALYRGIPCVTNAIGVQGLGVESGKHLLIAHDSNQFAAAVLELLEDEKKWEVISKNAREIARQEYTWKDLMNKHKAHLDALMVT